MHALSEAVFSTENKESEDEALLELLRIAVRITEFIKVRIALLNGRKLQNQWKCSSLCI